MTAASGPTGWRPTARHAAQIVAGIALAVALFVWGLPRIARTSWPEVWAVLVEVPLVRAAEFLVLVLIGLWCYTFTLTGSMPGLSHWRAFIVNIAGSSVSNLLPGGGAVGLAATFAMCRSWGFSGRAISTSAIVSGVWNILARMVLPVIALAALSVGSVGMSPVMRDAVTGAVTTGVVIVAVCVGSIASARVARAVGRTIDRLLRPLLRRRERRTSVDALVTDLRARILEVVRTGWLPMTLGLVGYFGFYYLCFLLVMRTTGVEIHQGQLFAAFAIGRLLTAIGITPGGVGVTESGAAAALVAFGAAPAEATAGVVLFSIFTHLLEVPLGALGWLAWSVMPKTPAPDVDDPVPTAR